MKPFPPSSSLHQRWYFLGTIVRSVLMSACISILPRVQATPYASHVTNDNGTVSFRLNEAAAGVKVRWNGGANEVDLGPRSAGLQVVNVGASGGFQIVVENVSAAGFTVPTGLNRSGANQISVDGSLVRFPQPRGLAVNTDPASPHFGRVYVANAAAGAITVTNFPGARLAGDGIYLLNPDLTDALGDGDVARTGGLDFVTGATVAPYRLSVGADGNLYVTDWSDANGSLYVTDPDVSPGSGANVLGGPVGSPFPVTATRFHGSIAAAVVEGSLSAGDLVAYVIDEDLQPNPASTTANARNSLWRHDIGSAVPGPAALPTRVGTTTPWINSVSQTMDLSRGPDGKFYVNNYRSGGTDRAGVYVLDATGTELWNSLTASRVLLGDATAPDLLRATGGGAVSPDGAYLAVVNLETNGVTVVPLVDGLPDLARRLVFDGMGTAAPQARDLAFDRAGNLYVVSQGAQLLRVFSPGGATSAVTGSDGTFALSRPPVLVSAVVIDDLAAEGGADSATFSVTRDGDLGVDLTVNFTLSGQAVNGTDYGSVPLAVTIPAGSAGVEVVIAPTDDNESEFSESVVFALTGGPGYTVGPGSVASAAIVDNDRAFISIDAADGNAQERFSNDTLSFVITRRGETNSELFIDYLAVSGTATPGADADELPIQFFLPAGAVTLTQVVSVRDDLEAEGNETFCLTLVPGFDPYDVGTPGSACATILDNESLPAPVLFSDDLNLDRSADWLVRFGANNQIYDGSVIWAYDYSTRGIPVAPSTLDGTTVGVFAQVNKTNASVAGAAGINLYPAGQTFSGNYALQFDMFLAYGSASTTEHAMVGLNHSGLLTNRVTQSATDTNNTARGGDGVWAAIETDGSNNRDYTLYAATSQTAVPSIVASRTAASLASIIPAPPYAVAGSPGRAWAQVELGQFDNVIYLLVNNNLIFQYTNTTGFRSGTVMLGHSDQFDSVGNADNFVIFDNIRVVRLDFQIVNFEPLPDERVLIEFASPRGGRADEFQLQSASSLSTPDWTDVAGVVEPVPTGFRIVAAHTSTARFYRIKRR